MPKVFVIMAKGFEEMELVITVDILRRAGVEVKTVSLDKTTEPVIGSRKIPIVPDETIDSVKAEDFDMMILPGGAEGTERLGKDERVMAMLKKFNKLDKPIAAICAAPTVVVKAGLGAGKTMTSHPSTEAGMTGAIYRQDRVVVDGKLITSRAAGTTFEFAFKIIEFLVGGEKVKEVNKGVLAHLP